MQKDPSFVLNHSIPPALSLFILRELPFSRFDFPRWQSVLDISLIGLLVGLDPSMRAAPPDMPAPPLWLAVVMGLVTTWVAFLVILGVLAWWLKRGGRSHASGSHTHRGQVLQNHIHRLS